MKYLLVLLVVIGAIWMLLKRSRPGGEARKPPPVDKAAGKPVAVTEMVACLHCGVHMPRSESVADAQGRLFCSSAHRDAGPR